MLTLSLPFEILRPRKQGADEVIDSEDEWWSDSVRFVCLFVLFLKNNGLNCKETNIMPCTRKHLKKY